MTSLRCKILIFNHNENLNGQKIAKKISILDMKIYNSTAIWQKCHSCPKQSNTFLKTTLNLLLKEIKMNLGPKWQSCKSDVL